MEYVLNWIVLLLSLGALGFIALVCYTDLVRGSTRTAVVSSTAPDYQAAEVHTPVSAVDSGPYVELRYSRDGAVEHVQKVYANRRGYIGTESYEGLGPGMPVRYVEVDCNNGQFMINNLDWQSPVRLRNDEGTETEVQVGQVTPVADGTQLLLSGGWTIACHLHKDGEP